jgi:hypothetical protein
MLCQAKPSTEHQYVTGSTRLKQACQQLIYKLIYKLNKNKEMLVKKLPEEQLGH